MPPDWDPGGTRVPADPRRAYDEMRRTCPVAMGSSGAWTFFSHADVRAAALADDTFSSAVSAHLQVPNGMDGAEHTRFRRLIDSHLHHERMVALAPTISTVATRIAAGLDLPGPVDAVELGSVFAVRAQSAWLGWPADLEKELIAWMAATHTASRDLDREKMYGGDAVVRPHHRLNCTAANRDPDAFARPDEFDPQGNAAHNLVYGIGWHMCPGRELATMELRALLRALLAVTEAIVPDTARTRRRGRPPVGGYEGAPLLLR